jgi:hypothetical protein
MRSMVIPRRSHQTESLERPKNAVRELKGMPLSVRMALGRPKSRHWLVRSWATGRILVGLEVVEILPVLDARSVS